MRRLSLIILGTLNVIINGLILLMMYVLTSKQSAYYANWNLPHSWILHIPDILLGIVFAAGIVLVVQKKRWAHVLVAAPLIANIFLAVVSTDWIKTAAMHRLDERNRRHMECIVRFQQEHPGKDSLGACPF